MFLLVEPAPRSETRSLNARELWKVAARTPLLVECLRGTLWVTAGAEDVLLEASESARFDGPLPLVVQALTDAELVVRKASARPK